MTDRRGERGASERGAERERNGVRPRRRSRRGKRLKRERERSGIARVVRRESAELSEASGVERGVGEGARQRESSRLAFLDVRCGALVSVCRSDVTDVCTRRSARFHVEAELCRRGVIIVARIAELHGDAHECELYMYIRRPFAGRTRERTREREREKKGLPGWRRSEKIASRHPALVARLTSQCSDTVSPKRTVRGM